MGTWMVLKSAGKIAPIPHWMSLRFPHKGETRIVGMSTCPAPARNYAIVIAKIALLL